MKTHPRATLGPAGRQALVAAVEGGMSLKAAAVLAPRRHSDMRPQGSRKRQLIPPRLMQVIHNAVPARHASRVQRATHRPPSVSSN
jgi:hypothetical protein